MALRRRGVDVTTAGEASLLGASDDAHLAYARRQDRAVLTHDADFLRMHAAGQEHAGILYCPPEAHSLGETIRLLVLVWELLEPWEMHGQIEFL